MREIEIGRVGYVYVLEASNGESVKIGRSCNPERRIAALRTQANTDGRYWVSEQQVDCCSLERECHAIHEATRLLGEWFSVGFDDAVKSIRELLTDPPTEAEIAEANKAAEEKAKKFFALFRKAFHSTDGVEEALSLYGSKTVLSILRRNPISSGFLVEVEEYAGASEFEVICALLLKNNRNSLDYSAALFCDAVEASKSNDAFILLANRLRNEFAELIENWA